MGRVITLAIESSTTVAGVAIASDDGPLGSIEINQGRRHAEVLTPAIEFVCHHAQIAIGDIGAIGVDIGPGLFTGMRVGIATAKAMSQALQIPVVGISSLDLLAHPIRERAARSGPAVIASVIDARKGEVFYAFYRAVDDGVQRISEPRACSVDDFNAEVSARGQGVLAVGDGAWRYRELLQAGIEVVALAHPSAVTLAQLARTAALKSGLDSPAEGVHPMYLRAPDAQINWSTR